MRKIESQKGFTVIELILLTIVAGVIIVFILPGCTRDNFRDYRHEAISNLHIIQMALERYAVDQNGMYPKYILGGDKQGWSPEAGCDAIVKHPPFATNLRQTNREGGGARPPYDPLMELGYMDRYPRNPFTYENNDILTLSGGEVDKPGSGDVRFGYNGTLTGNILDDPRFLWDIYPIFDQPDNMQLQPTRLVNTFAPSAYKKNIFSLHPRNKINPFYSMGGMPDENDPQKMVAHWWPGEFLYRATGKMQLKKDVNPDKLKVGGKLNIWDFEIQNYDRYILGVYGEKSRAGMDIIRLTMLDGTPINNHSGILSEPYKRSSLAPYGEGVSVLMSLPEVFGGGEKGSAPIFPYFKNENGEEQLVYGAPDGYPDGIIAYVNNEGNSFSDSK